MIRIFLALLLCTLGLTAQKPIFGAAQVARGLIRPAPPGAMCKNRLVQMPCANNFAHKIALFL